MLTESNKLQILQLFLAYLILIYFCQKQSDWSIVLKKIRIHSFGNDDLYKDWELENNTNLNPFFYLIKSSEIEFISFTCILPDYMAHSISKEFWKNSHFKNMTAGFLRRCKNLLRWIAPKMMHFRPWKKLILTNNAL